MSNVASLDMRSFEFNASVDLETTSEGLGDFIREIFSIDRTVYNEYQVKAMKMLLSKKSHAQVAFFSSS